jgi:ribosomal protein S18 acetylase RimI-like enzyme
MEVRALDLSSLAEALAVWRAANETSVLADHPDNLRKWAEQEGARIFGAFDGGQLIGMALSLATRANDGAGDVVPGARHLTGVAVLPDHRRRGVGQALLRAAIADAEVDGISRMSLWTHTTNEPARRLFEANGFHPAGRRAADAVGAEMVLLELELTA